MDYIGLVLYVNKVDKMMVGSSAHVKGSSLLLSRITVQAESNFRIAQMTNRNMERYRGITLLVFR